MKIRSWSAGISRCQMTLLHTSDGSVSVCEPEVVETWATFWPSFCPASMIAFTNTITAKERSRHCVESLLSLPLPQIKISVIKLIKVMHANMPLGSRPDFIHHTVVESCRSFTFDVAFFIIENNWIPSLPYPPCLRLSQTHTDFAHVHSGHALLNGLLWGFQTAF